MELLFDSIRTILYSPTATRSVTRNSKSTTSYPAIAVLAVPTNQVLADAKHGLEQDVILKTERMVYLEAEVGPDLYNTSLV